MRRRSGNRAEQELTALVDRRTQLAAEEDRLGAAIETAREAVVEAREAEAVAVLDDAEPEVARRRRLEAEAALTTATADLDVLRRTIRACEKRIEAKREDVRAEQLTVAQAELERTLKERTADSRALVETLTAASNAGRRVVNSRERVRELERQVRELGGDPMQADEVEAWPDTAALVELLSTSQPLTPLADAARAERKRQADAENAVARERQHALDQAKALAWLTFPRDGEQEAKLEGFLNSLPEHLRDEARSRYESERATVMSRGRGRLQRIEV